MFKSHAADQFLIAVKLNKPSEISRLAALGIGVNTPIDRVGRTALHYAVIHDKLSCVKSLIAAGADINKEYENGLTALHRAVVDGHPFIVRTLVAAGCLLDKQDENNNTALHEAAWSNHINCSRILLDAKANVNIKNKTGFTPLHLAAQNGHSSTVQVLLDHKAYSMTKNNYGDTPLHVAARYGHYDVMKILITAGANKSLQNNAGDTPLHIAARVGHEQVAAVIVDSGNLIAVKNNVGETARDVAIRCGHRNISSMIPTNSLPRGLKKQRPKSADVPRLYDSLTSFNTTHTSALFIPVTGVPVAKKPWQRKNFLKFIKWRTKKEEVDRAERRKSCPAQMTTPLTIKFEEMCSIEKQYSKMLKDGSPRSPIGVYSRERTAKNWFTTDSDSLSSTISSSCHVMDHNNNNIHSSQSKDDLHDKPTDQAAKPDQHKQKGKFLGLFRNASDQDLQAGSKTRRSFGLRRKKKNQQHEIINGVIKDHTDNQLPEYSLPDSSLQDNSLPDSSLPDNTLESSFPENVLNNVDPENRLPVSSDLEKSPHVERKSDLENNNIDHELSVHIIPEVEVNTELPVEEFPLKTLESPPVVLPHPVSFEPYLEDPLPPDDLAWKRAKEVWEKSETEEQNENVEERKRRKEKKQHSDRKKEDGRKDEKKHRSKSRSKDRKESEQSESKNKSKDRKRHNSHGDESHERTNHKHSDKHGDKHSDKHGKDERYKHEDKHGKEERLKHGDKHGKDERHKHEDKHGKEERLKHGDKHGKDDRHKHEDKHGKDERHKHEDKHGKDDRHKTDKHRRKHGEESFDGSEDMNDNERRHRKHKHSRKHGEKHVDEKHDQKHGEKHSDRHSDRQSDKHSDRHHKDEDRSYKHKEKRKHHEKGTHHDDKHATHDQKHATHEREPSDEHKRVELDKVWREYESGKRYYAVEKDMKKVIDRLDGVDRYRKEERKRSSDRSRGFSSDTSCEVTHRSRSRERRRRSRSREKNKHESDQDTNPQNTWNYSLGRIEARQEQCKADIDTARRSIEHRIKQLETRLQKQYSSSEKLPDRPCDKLDANEAQDIKKMIDKVSDECREVTRTLDVRTEEMKSEIATVVREEFSNLDERLSIGYKSPGSPISFYGMQVDDFPAKNKLIDDVTTSLTSFQRLSSADESMITVIEENSRATAESRESPIRVSQSGALDTQSEPALPLEPCTSSEIGPPDSPLTARSKAFENLYELSLQSLEDEDSFEEGSDMVSTTEPPQNMYRRKIQETEQRCQERALAEKELLYKRINDLESMLLAAKSAK